MQNTLQALTELFKINHLKILLKYASVLFLLSYSWMFEEITVPNERTRIYLSVAIVDYGTVSIDRPVRRFGKTADMAKFDGRLYTDKAPGTGFLGAALYGVVRIFSPPCEWDIVELINLMRTFMMLPCAILALFILRRLLSSHGITPEWTDITSFFWILGTSAFHYSTAFYGHQLAAMGLLIALLFLSQSVGMKSAPLKMLFSGLGCGFSGIMEYQSVIPAFFIFVFIVIQRRNWRDIAYFIIGASPFALLLLGYNTIAFDGPFELSYHHLASKKVQSLHSTGIGGVSFPKQVAVVGSLFSLHRGLLSTSPLLLLIPWGVWRMYTSGKRSSALLITIIIGYYLLFIFGADAWYAGWSFGPRLLVPMMGIAMIPVAVASTHISATSLWHRGLVFGLGIWGVLYHQSIHLTFPEMPETAHNPMLDLVVPAIRADILSPNLFSKLSGSSELWQIFPVSVVIGVLLWTVAARLLRQLTVLETIRFVVIALLPTLLMMSIIYLVGPRWSPAKTERFLDWMHRMSITEYEPE